MTMRQKAILALCLFVPAPSIGVLLSLHLGQSTLGVYAWVFAKFWLFIGPLLWLWLVERQKITGFKWATRGLLQGTLLGVAVFCVIWGSYYFFARGHIDLENFHTKLSAVGLTSVGIYLLLSAYWTFINSALEEYVFRFFFYQQAEKVWRKPIAIAMVALFFTIHHTLALAAYVPWWQNVLASLGVFIGSVMWSWLYAHYKTIIPAYICHVFADIAVFSIGFDLLFLN